MITIYLPKNYSWEPDKIVGYIQNNGNICLPKTYSWEPDRVVGYTRGNEICLPKNYSWEPDKVIGYVKNTGEICLPKNYQWEPDKIIGYTLSNGNVCLPKNYPWEPDKVVAYVIGQPFFLGGAAFLLLLHKSDFNNFLPSNLEKPLLGNQENFNSINVLNESPLISDNKFKLLPLGAIISTLNFDASSRTNYMYQFYQAKCKDHYQGPWLGKKSQLESRAMEEAEEHNKILGHNATVERVEPDYYQASCMCPNGHSWLPGNLPFWYGQRFYDLYGAEKEADDHNERFHPHSPPNYPCRARVIGFVN